MNAVLTAILAVFTAIGEWIVTAVNDMSTLFYAESGLTLIGTLSICGLAISVILLIVRIIQNFLNFRS